MTLMLANTESESIICLYNPWTYNNMALAWNGEQPSDSRHVRSTWSFWLPSRLQTALFVQLTPIFLSAIHAIAGQ